MEYGVPRSLSCAALARTVVFGLYVIGGELAWIIRSFPARIRRTPPEELSAWRRAQIENRKQRFSLKE
jgi:hypothetical protein